MIKAYAAFKAQGELKPFEYDPGELGDNQVEIDVDYCGICHSDLSMINNAWELSSFPIVPGHEVAGRIAKIGKNVTNFKVGESVGLGWHAGFCNTCKQCGAGDHNLCATASGTMISRHGGFADKVRADANSVVVIPAGIDLESAGPLFCGGITVFNPLVQYNISPTAKVGVIGIGGLGHLALQFLNAWGCEVTAFTSSEAKKEEALRLGAHHVLDTHNDIAVEAAAGKFDLILSTVNVKLNWDLYLSTITPKGRLHYLGATLDSLDINVFSLLMQQRTVSGSIVGSPDTIAKMLEFAKLHNIKPQVEVFKMEDVNTALEKLRNGNVKYRLVLSNK